MIFLGIDGGGSKTAFLLEDETGRELGRVVTGPSNWLSAGDEVARRNIRSGIQQLKAVPDAVCAGFAGAGRPEALRFYKECLSELLPHSKIFVETDAFIAYIGAIGLEPGVLLIAGTGSIAIGRRPNGEMIRVGGWGPIFSDDGSGFWIGRAAIRIALQAHDADADPEYVASVCETLQLQSITEISSAWKSGALTVQSVAALANMILTKYPARSYTRRIMRVGGIHLSKLVETAVARVGIPNCRKSVAGSIGNHPLMRGMIKMQFDEPAQPPERGAIIWAHSQVRC